MSVPFFRPSITEAEIDEVVSCLRSGWLTTGPRTKQFEADFAEKVGAKHAIALNSCTAALHLALEAIGLQRGDLVLVPTMTFAATAEVVRYFDAVPVLVDVEPDTLNLDVAAARRTIEAIERGEPTAGLKPPYGPLKAICPVHYGGQMADVDAVRTLAREKDLRIIEDAAHCMPAYAKDPSSDAWRPAGTTAEITCFSFYANKCITTGEGGMAVTDDDELASRMRIMSLHGLSKDAWRRFERGASWYYEIVAPGFKYNLTDVASSIGLHQLRRADELWEERQKLAARYLEALAPIEGLSLPVERDDRKSSWHLFPIRVQKGAWKLDRAAFIDELSKRGVGSSVHWMPLHLHPYYRETYGYGPGLFPVAEAAWEELVSLPLFPGMTEAELAEVVAAIAEIRVQHGAGSDLQD